MESLIYMYKGKSKQIKYIRTDGPYMELSQISLRLQSQPGPDLGMYGLRSEPHHYQMPIFQHVLIMAVFALYHPLLRQLLSLHNT